MENHSKTGGAAFILSEKEELFKIYLTEFLSTPHSFSTFTHRLLKGSILCRINFLSV